MTPIQPQDDVGHGQVLDSDSLSDFQGQTDKRMEKGRRAHKRSERSRERFLPSDTKGQRSYGKKSTLQGNMKCFR